jgi:hypothetical protein
MNPKKTISFIAILATAHLLGCVDMHMNTPTAGQPTAIAAKNKPEQSRFVLPVWENVELGDGTIDDRVLLLKGQIVYSLTPVSDRNGTFVDLELNVELELGEGLGWKIAGASIDRLNLRSQSERSIQKAYLIDQTNETRKLNLLFNVSQAQLVVKRIWISHSSNDGSPPEHP